jgi:hypothetical protein
MSDPRTAAGRALLAELSESPLSGARYAYHVVSLRIAAIEAEAASSSDELRAALEELQSILNGIRSDGPVMDSLTAEGPWWTPPDPTGVRLYDAIIGASDAIDRTLSDSRRLRKEGIDASLASVLDAFHGAIHDRCGEAWIEAETALASLVSDGWTRAALHASRLDADKEGETR